ncbi:MAG: methylated-DNA--[protein]-cysteine S-methyltransferase [Candidatus Saccharibacteria bacterium]|nr:methylated-DNA--[protein]-cysteine S-methyltransferase [Candidatus Saccharibacteria bacterium]
MIELPTSSFRDRVYALMASLPEGRITTYGDLAAMAGHPYAARQVGAIAHGSPIDLPWHRLVNARGGLAVGFPGGQEVQRQLLAQDGIQCDDEWRVVDFEERRWRPDR